MSSAFFPLGMNSWNNRTGQNGYKTWKGRGVYSNPIGVTSTHIRPLTNRDPGNVFPTGFGLARPIKHYRRGTVIPTHYELMASNSNDNGIKMDETENSLIAYNMNREVKSSFGGSLGGGGGGMGMIGELMGSPGGVIIKDNDRIDSDINDCGNCKGVKMVSSWYPINNLTEKPQTNVTNPLLCCNQQRKAMQRVLPCSTNLKKNYFQTTYAYLYNRCQTFDQRSFNFLRGPIDKDVLQVVMQYPFVTAKLLEYAKPGSALSLAFGDLYVAQCNPNGTIKLGVEIAFVEAMTIVLLNNGIITESQRNEIINTLQEHNFDSFTVFLTYLHGILGDVQYRTFIDYLYQINTAGTGSNNQDSLSELMFPSKGCARVYYKPNNPQYAVQGGVSSSTRILKLNVDTINTAYATQRRINDLAGATFVEGNSPAIPFIYKAKGAGNAGCQAQTYTGNPFFFQGQKQNKLICRKPGSSNGAEYKTYVSLFQHQAGNDIGSVQP